MRRQILIPGGEISEIVARVAREVDQHYDDKDLGLLILGVLKGGLSFTNDLGRALWVLGYENTELGFVQSSSYGQRTVSSGEPNLAFLAKREDIEGKHVLLAEDLVDTAATLSAILIALSKFFPASLAVATLLSKPDKQQVEWPNEVPLFVGQKLKGDPWVEGCSIDTREKNRFAPDIRVVTQEPMTMEEARKMYLAD